MKAFNSSVDVGRRRLLRTSFVFSALATLGSVPRIANALQMDEAATDLLMVGDWGYHDATAQSNVASGMRLYARQHGIKSQALLMLGDNWYGELAGGPHSPRWKTEFEEMYPAETFDCPTYAILGNHDYQRWPESKVDAELEYARIGRTRWMMPARWYRFEFPVRN